MSMQEIKRDLQMIELNGIYKLKILKGLGGDRDMSDYKVIAMNGEYIICKKLNGEDAGEQFFFLKEFLIDPEKPNDIYSKIKIIKN